MHEHLDKHQLFESNYKELILLNTDNKLACNLIHLRYYSVIQLIFYLIIEKDENIDSQSDIRSEFFNTRGSELHFDEKGYTGYHVFLNNKTKFLLFSGNNNLAKRQIFNSYFKKIKSLRTGADYEIKTYLSVDFDKTMDDFNKIIDLLNKVDK